MSDVDPEIRQNLNGSVYSPTSNVSSDAPHSFRRKPVRTSIKIVANAARAALGLRDEEQVFELPGRLFEQLPFAVYVCDRNGLVLRYNRRAAELWGRSPEPGDPNERFCGSYRMFRPDGSPLPHHQCPMADVLRTGIFVRAQEVHIERPDGSRGIALVDIEAIKDSGNTLSAPSTASRTSRSANAARRKSSISRARPSIEQRTSWPPCWRQCVSRAPVPLMISSN